MKRRRAGNCFPSLMDFPISFLWKKMREKKLNFFANYTYEEKNCYWMSINWMRSTSVSVCFRWPMDVYSCKIWEMAIWIEFLRLLWDGRWMEKRPRGWRQINFIFGFFKIKIFKFIKKFNNSKAASPSNIFYLFIAPKKSPSSIRSRKNSIDFHTFSSTFSNLNSFTVFSLSNDWKIFLIES